MQHRYTEYTPSRLYRDPSISRIKSLKPINKQDHTNKSNANSHRSTKTLNRSYSVESLDIETDNIIENLNLADPIYPTPLLGQDMTQGQFF